MTEAAKAMATWLGALSRPGFTMTSRERAGLSVASYVLGEGKLDALRTWFAFQPKDVQGRELKATIEAIIHMAHVDRDFDDAERVFLEHTIDNASLPDDAKKWLRLRLDDPQPLAHLAERITQPILREMLLALCWELAMADDRIAPEEVTAYDDFARKLDVPGMRASEMREALTAEV